MLDLGEIVHHVQLEYFVTGETKLDHSFPSAQFKLADYETRTRWNREWNWSEIIEYARKD